MVDAEAFLMPTEPYRDAEPGEDRPVGGIGGIIPPTTDPVSQYPGLVRRHGFWYDPSHDQWYDDNYRKISNPTVSKPGPVNPQYPQPHGTAKPGDPDPGDGPVGNEPPDIQVKPGPTPVPGTPEWERAQNGYGPSPTNYLPVPPAWSGQGPYQLANPMPVNPGIGTAKVSKWQSWGANQQNPTSASSFKPWGFPVGEVSKILRYGGRPDMSRQGGFEGVAAVAGPQLGGVSRGGVDLPGVGSSIPPGGGNVPPSAPPPAGSPPVSAPPASPPPVGTPTNTAPDGSPIIRGQLGPKPGTGGYTNWLKYAHVGENVPRTLDGENLTVDQLRYLLRTQGAILRGKA